MSEDRLKQNGFDPEDDRMEDLNRFRSAASISMTPELFEKLYLSPQNKIHGDLRKTFANPTPIPIAGFLLCLTPLSIDLMGWRGAGGNGAAGISIYFFQGGVLMTVGAILEWIIGNTFPAVVFASFGTFWLAYGGLLNPSFAAYTSYAPDAESVTAGLQTRGFNASIAYWFLFMGLLCFIYLICSLRTNIVFFIIFLTLVVAFGLLTGAFLLNADNITGNAAKVEKLLVGAGACTFITSMAGWWIFLALLLASVDFPIQIPVGDLSTVIKGKNDRK